MRGWFPFLGSLTSWVVNGHRLVKVIRRYLLVSRGFLSTTDFLFYFCQPFAHHLALTYFAFTLFVFYVSVNNSGLMTPESIRNAKQQGNVSVVVLFIFSRTLSLKEIKLVEIIDF